MARRGLVGLAAAVLLIGYVWCDLVVVRGPSMRTTYYDGDWVLAVRMRPLSMLGLEHIVLGTDRIVLFGSPLSQNELLIKRIVATGGETVAIRDGQ
jgi:signal peptidase I